MGTWGVKSYEVDEAADALDAGFDRVHGRRYEELMDDRNPLPYEEVQRQLAGPETLAAALEALSEEFGADRDAWDEVARLAFAGVVVRHAELRVPIPGDLRTLAIAWLKGEDLDWERGATVRQLRRQWEIALLQRTQPGGTPT